MAISLKVNTTKAAESKGGTGSSYISKSGIYDVVINFASIEESSGGANSVNFNITYNDNEGVLYGPYITNKAGDELEFGMKLVRDELGTIAGADSLTIEEEDRVVGKDKVTKTLNVIQEYSDLPVKVRVQEEYSINPKTNAIKKSLVIKDFFREDGASAAEIINETEIGKRLAFLAEKAASNVTYKDNLTAEDVAAWQEDKVAAAKGTATPKATVAPTAKKNGLFKS